VMVCVRAIPYHPLSFSPSLSQSIKAWVEKILGRTIEGGLLDSARDGVLLCELMNKVRCWCW